VRLFFFVPPPPFISSFPFQKGENHKFPSLPFFVVRPPLFPWPGPSRSILEDTSTPCSLRRAPLLATPRRAVLRFPPLAGRWWESPRRRMPFYTSDTKFPWGTSGLSGGGSITLEPEVTLQELFRAWAGETTRGGSFLLPSLFQGTELHWGKGSPAKRSKARGWGFFFLFPPRGPLEDVEPGFLSTPPFFSAQQDRLPLFPARIECFHPPFPPPKILRLVIITLPSFFHQRVGSLPFLRALSQPLFFLKQVGSSFFPWSPPFPPFFLNQKTPAPPFFLSFFPLDQNVFPDFFIVTVSFSPLFFFSLESLFFPASFRIFSSPLSPYDFPPLFPPLFPHDL